MNRLLFLSFAVHLAISAAAASLSAGSVPQNEINGEVRDRLTGAPIVGAEVWARDEPERGVRTDDEGRYRLEVHGTVLMARAEGYFQERRVIHDREEHRGPRFELDRSVPFKGRVVDVDDAPIEGVHVELESLRPLRGWQRDRNGGSAVSAADGTFTVAAVRPAIPHEATFSHDAYVRHETRLVTPRPGEQPVYEARLETGCAGQGRVVDDTGRPIVDAEVLLTGEPDVTTPMVSTHFTRSPRHHRRAMTRDDGVFAIGGLSNGSWTLGVSADGYAQPPLERIRVLTNCTPIDFGIVELARAISLEGWVFDIEGTPLAGATAQIFGGPETKPITATTDDAGRFELDGLGAGRRYHLDVGREGFRSANAQAVVPPLDHPLEITLQRNGGLAGRVIDDDGRAVSDFIVRFETSEGNFSGSTHYVDDDGRFSRDDLPTGSYRLEIEARGWRPTILEGVMVDEGRTTKGIEVMMHRGITVTGVLTDPDGVPLAGAQVFALRGRRLVPSETTTSDGHFRIDGIDDPKVLLSALHPDHLHTRQRFMLETDVPNHVIFTMDRGYRVSGVVLDLEAQPVKGAMIGLVTPTPEAILELGPPSTADGTFDLGYRAAGSYRLEAKRMNGALIDSFDIVLDRNLDLVIRADVVTNGSLRGVVRGVDRLADVVLTVGLLSNSMAGKQTRVASNGRFHIGDLEPGEWLVAVSHTSSDARHSESIVISPDTETWIEIELQP